MDARKNFHIFEGEKETAAPKKDLGSLVPANLVDPKKALENLVDPKKALEHLVDPKKALENLVDPKKALENLVDPKKALENLVDPKKALDNLLPDINPFHKPENKDSDKSELKHLEFVRLIALNALVVALKLYEYVKGKSGPFKSGLDIAESVFKTLCLPLCRTVRSMAHELLVFLDGKVDEAEEKLEQYVPSSAKQVVKQVWEIVKEISEAAITVLKEAHSGGPSAAIGAAISIAKQLLLKHMMKMLLGAHQLPGLNIVSKMAFSGLAEKGLDAFKYNPFVAVDEMANALTKQPAGIFKHVFDAKKEDETASASASASAQSNTEKGWEDALSALKFL